MNSHLAKTLSTAAAWVGAAIILVPGLYRVPGGTGLFYLVGTMVVVGGAALTSSCIWWPAAVAEKDEQRGFDVLPASEVTK